MKKKEFKKKLSLNKQTITSLNKQEQVNIKGGTNNYEVPPTGDAGGGGTETAA